jgi:acetate kinase
VDAFAFTGGVGENAAMIRSRAVAALAFTGARLDESRNADPPRPDAVVGAEDSAVGVVVVEAREDVEIAREVRAVVESG